MLGLLLTTFLLILHSVVSSTSKNPKSDEGWYPSWSLGNSVSRGGRDQRSTHWESRFHSNLDDDRRGVDDDTDRGHGQISYPLLVDQSSPLGPAASRDMLSGKFFNEIDTLDDDNDSRLDHCITIVRKPIVLVSVADRRQSFEDMRNLQLSPANSGRFGTVRCRRRIQGWTIQEPVYVEEPRWVIIDLNRQIGSSNSMTTDDPFYVARGKRSLQLSDDNRRARIRTNNDYTEPLISEEDSASGVVKKDQPTVTRRKKRDAVSDVLRSTLIEGLGANREKGNTHSYVSPRNKHSDILDILNEPFFISRGKKDFVRMRRYEWYNRKQTLDGDILPITETRKRATSFVNCDPRSNDCFVNSLTVGRQVDPRSIVDDPLTLRDRRGVMEELLKEGDPFYVARGKRSPLSRITQVLKDNSSQQSWSSLSTGLSNDHPTMATSISKSTTQNIDEKLSIKH